MSKNLLKANLIFMYYKNDNILDTYYWNLSDFIVIDNDCLDIEFPENLFIIPLKKYNQLKQENEQLKQINEEHRKLMGN